MASIRVGAVVLHYRHWPGVATCLARLQDQSVPPARIVVVDNASGDGSATAIGDAFPGVEVLVRPHNLGYAAGMNAGVAALGASVDAVLLITHDCWLAEHTLEHLARRLEEAPWVGAVGPALALHDQPSRLYSAGGTIDASTWAMGHLWDAQVPALDDWCARDPQAVMWLDGACVLLRTQALGDAGPLDERYFLYYEDADYGIRLRRAGWSIECVPRAQAWHRPGASSLLLDYLVVRNQLVLVFQHAPWRVRGRYLRAVLAGLVKDGLSLDAGRRSRAWAGARGLVDFSARRLGPPGGTGPAGGGSSSRVPAAVAPVATD